MIYMRNFLRKILIAIFALFIATPGFAFGEIGDFGSWGNEENRQLITGRITEELQNFGPTHTDVDGAYVPLEAKFGLAFMGGIASVGDALEDSFLNFAILFMLIAYAFWVAFEAYNLIGSGSGGDAKKVVETVLKKGVLIAAWLVLLKMGISWVFSMIMLPIVSAGTFIATIIWESVTEIAGYSMHSKEVCDAIRVYAETNTPENLKMSADAAAGLLCIPSQMSSFFVTIMDIAWDWVLSGIGFSLFTSLIGLYITYLCLKSIWKYLFVALGVIADIFLSILLLPFTAIAETIAKTSYKGIAGDIFNSFLDIFKAEKLETQINRIIKAALYFVCLAVATGVSISLLTFVVDPYTGHVLSAGGFDGAIMLILSLLLVCYMADKANDLATKWGGKIEGNFGDQVKKDVTNLWKVSKSNWEKLRKLGKK